MINIHEIEEEIKKLESKDYLTFDICNKLAMLYTVRNNYKPLENNKMELEMSKSAVK